MTEKVDQWVADPAFHSKDEVQDVQIGPFGLTHDAAFDDLEAVLYNGFLTAHIDIGDIGLTLKSLLPSEVQMAHFSGGLSVQTDRRAVLRLQRYVLASSIFMVDGVNYLADRARAFPELLQMVSEFPDDLCRRLAARVSYLADRTNRCATQVEGYTFGALSRQRWLVCRDSAVNHPSVTGILGTDALGLNHCQQIWTILNRMEDTRQEREAAWDNAKFTASAFNSKGVRSIDQKDKSRRKHLDAQRFLAYQRAVGQDPDEGVLRVAAETTEDLAAQLNQTMRGEKDLHDLIVEKMEQHMRAEHDLQQAEAQAWRDNVPDDAGFIGGDSYAVTLEDLRREVAAVDTRRRVVSPHTPGRIPASPEDRSRLVAKFRPPDVTRLTPDEAAFRDRPDEALER